MFDDEKDDERRRKLNYSFNYAVIAVVKWITVMFIQFITKKWASTENIFQRLEVMPESPSAKRDGYHGNFIDLYANIRTLLALVDSWTFIGGFKLEFLKYLLLNGWFGGRKWAERIGWKWKSKKKYKNQN